MDKSNCLFVVYLVYISEIKEVNKILAAYFYLRLVMGNEHFKHNFRYDQSHFIYLIIGTS